MNPLVSIVIPTYNRAQDLERALNSVRSQTYSNWEALIVDNHSNDNTDEVVRLFDDPRIQVFKIHNHGVVAASRNVGIKNASGKYIAFLDSDDWWSPKKLEESLKYLERGSDLVYHDMFLVTKCGARHFWRKIRTRDLKSPVFNDLIVNGNVLGNSSVVVRRELLNAIGGLSEDPNLIAAEDYHAWLRIAGLTNKFQRMNMTLGYYWAGGGNISNPNRVVKYVDVIEKYFENAIINLGLARRIYWLAYVKGKAYYQMGFYDLAVGSIKDISWGQAPFLIYIKSRWMLLLTNLCHAKRMDRK